MLRTLSYYWKKIQGCLFPQLEEELGPLTKKQQQAVSILELVRVEQFVHNHFGCKGRPPKDRIPLARSFVIKAVYNMTTTRVLIERVKSDISLRRICGWEKQCEIPHESAFAEFAESALPEKVHSALISKMYKNCIVEHISRDSTAIEAREKPEKKENKKTKKAKKRGRPKKGEKRFEKELTRLEKQPTMTQEERLRDLPKQCDVGTKKNSKGYKETWIGYKLHIDTADGDIPLSCILTSASLHDSQASIPLAVETSEKSTSLYDPSGFSL